MNDDHHLLLLESAARFYCKHKDIDPDRDVEVKATTGLILPRQRVRMRPAWMFIADELFDLNIRLRALQIAQRDANATQTGGQAVRVQ